MDFFPLLTSEGLPLWRGSTARYDTALPLLPNPLPIPLPRNGVTGWSPHHAHGVSTEFRHYRSVEPKAEACLPEDDYARPLPRFVPSPDGHSSRSVDKVVDVGLCNRPCETGYSKGDSSTSRESKSDLARNNGSWPANVCSCSTPWPPGLFTPTTDHGTFVIDGRDYCPGSAGVESATLSPISHIHRQQSRSFRQGASESSNGEPDCGARSWGLEHNEAPKCVICRQSKETGCMSECPRGAAPIALGRQSDETGADNSTQGSSSLAGHEPRRRAATMSGQFKPTSNSVFQVACGAQRRSFVHIAAAKPRVTGGMPNPATLFGTVGHTRGTLRRWEFHAQGEGQTLTLWSVGAILPHSYEEIFHGERWTLRGFRTRMECRRLGPLSVVAPARGQERNPPPLIKRGKENYPLPYPVIPKKPPEVECLCTVGSPSSLNKSMGHDPHPLGCHSAGNDHWGTNPPFPRNVAIGIHDHQRGGALSTESEPFFRFPQTPGYIRVEMTPGRYRDLGEPSQIGSTQGGCPLVFGRSDGVGVPIFVGVFAPPPPTATQGQREGGGTAEKEVPFPGPPPSYPRVLFGSTSRSGALEAYGKQIVFGASRIALAMVWEGGATRVGSLSGTYPPPLGGPHRESENQRACNGPSSPCWAPLFPGIDPVPLRPGGLGATRGKEKKKIQGTMGGGFPIFKVRGPANSLPQSCLYGPGQIPETLRVHSKG